VKGRIVPVSSEFLPTPVISRILHKVYRSWLNLKLPELCICNVYNVTEGTVHLAPAVFMWKCVGEVEGSRAIYVGRWDQQTCLLLLHNGGQRLANRRTQLPK
jgi:hypothetical protein